MSDRSVRMDARFNPSIRRNTQRRHGGIVVLTAVLMISMLAMMAFAIDIGYMQIARTDAQRAADAAALDAAWQLVDAEAATGDSTALQGDARTRAASMVSRNEVLGMSCAIDENSANVSTGDVVLGRLDDPSNRSEVMSFANPNSYNSVQVTVSMTQAKNGPVQLFFGGLFGSGTASISATATASFADKISGFRVTPDTGNASLIPFVVHVDDWADLMAGNGDDDYSYDALDGSINNGSDGVRESKGVGRR